MRKTDFDCERRAYFLHMIMEGYKRAKGNAR
jgi:hypothetical protein